MTDVFNNTNILFFGGVLAEPQSINVSKIFGSEDFYFIPKYQRRYKWSPDDCEDLWNDVIKVVDRDLDRHYLGTIIITEPKQEVDMVKYEVVDGQQRLTTLSILFFAIEQIIIALLKNNPDDRILVFQKDTVDRILRIKDPEAIDYFDHVGRLKLQVNDDIVLKNLLAYNSSIDTSSRIYVAYQKFIELLRNKISIFSSFEEKRDFIRNLINSLLTRVSLIKITTNEKNEVHSIFESLNNRGVELDEIDLIKNYFMMQLGSDSTKFYEKYWSSFDIEDWWSKGSLAKASESRLSNCFFWFLRQQPYINTVPNTTIQTLKKSPDTMYKDFILHVEALARNSNITRQESLAVLLESFAFISKEYKKLHDFVVEKKSPITFGKTIKEDETKKQRLQEFVDRVGIYPYSWAVVIWIIRNESVLSSRDYCDILRIFETFIIRKRIVNTSNLEAAVTDFITRMNRVASDQAKTELIRRIEAAMLNNSKDFSMPTDEQVIFSLVNYPIKRIELARTILYAVEEETTDRTSSDKSERRLSRAIPNKDGKNLAAYEIEHILPRKWEEHWALDKNTELSVINRRHDYTGFIGNLVILTSEVNNRVKNYNFNLKVKEYKRNRNSIYLVRDFLEVYASDDNMITWNESLIEKRSKELAEQVISIWDLNFIDVKKVNDSKNLPQTIANIADKLDKDEVFFLTEDHIWTSGTFQLNDKEQTVLVYKPTGKPYTSLTSLFKENDLLGKLHRKNFWDRIFIERNDDSNFSVTSYLSSSKDYDIPDDEEED